MFVSVLIVLMDHHEVIVLIVFLSEGLFELVNLNSKSLLNTVRINSSRHPTFIKTTNSLVRGVLFILHCIGVSNGLILKSLIRRCELPYLNSLLGDHTAIVYMMLWRKLRLFVLM